MIEMNEGETLFITDAKIIMFSAAEMRHQLRIDPNQRCTIYATTLSDGTVMDYRPSVEEIEAMAYGTLVEGIQHKQWIGWSHAVGEVLGLPMALARAQETKIANHDQRVEVLMKQRDTAEAKYIALQDKYFALKSLGFWQRLVFLFKGNK